MKQAALSFFSLCLVVLFQTGALAQISINSTTPVTQNFDGTGANLPANWRMSNAFTLTTNAGTAIGNSVLNFATVTGVLNGMNLGGPAASNIPAGATVSAFTGTTVPCPLRRLQL